MHQRFEKFLQGSIDAVRWNLVDHLTTNLREKSMDLIIVRHARPERVENDDSDGPADRHFRNSA